MPEYWEPGEDGEGKVSVPITKALKIIKGLGFGSQVHTNNDISIFRTYDGFKIIVPASRSKGGEIYLDTDLLELMEKKNFEKTSDKMVAIMPEYNLEALVEILQSKFSTSVTLTPFQFDMIKSDITKRDASVKHFPRLKTTPKPATQRTEASIIRLMEMEAIALELELELLNFAA